MRDFSLPVMMFVVELVKLSSDETLLEARKKTNELISAMNEQRNPEIGFKAVKGMGEVLSRLDKLGPLMDQQDAVPGA